MATAATPFRAGRLPGEFRTGPAAAAAHPATLIPGVVLAVDISEFQLDIGDAKYLAWSQAVIIRAAYGANHDDKAWYGGARRDALHAGGARFIGCYQYVVAGQDPAVQAREFCRLIGAPRPGEYYFADIEEGAGDLRATRDTWRRTVSAVLGPVPTGVYSGLFFARDHGLAPVEWVAAYGPAEPSPPHTWWQFTDAMTIPGIPGTCDCSVFHGSIDDLAALAYDGQVPPPPPPVTTWEDIVTLLPVLAQGAAGDAVRTAQGLLAARGHPVTVDGQFGPATATAVRAVQSAAHVTADAVIGPVTWKALAGL